MFLEVLKNPVVYVPLTGALVNLMLGLLRAEEANSKFVRAFDAALAAIFPDPVGFVVGLVGKAVK